MSFKSKQARLLVRRYHWIRSGSFALLFLVASLQSTNLSYGLAEWLLLGMLLLVLPHLQFWRAHRAENSLQAEMHNLLIDSAVLGMVLAMLEFPLWISFTASIVMLANHVVNQGWPGLTRALLTLCAGVLAAIAAMGFSVSYQTDWPVKLLCILFLSGYFLLLSSRNLEFGMTRAKAKVREQELLAVNQNLQRKLREIADVQKQLREDANRDPLTKLYNRRYLDSTLERELSRCKREGNELALILIDIDHFKKINDSYGHPAGDAVLQEIGRLLLEMTRSADVACRYGGEEFLLLMPTMSLDAALKRAEKLRATVADLVMTVGQDQIRGTLSIGIAAYPLHGSSADELIGHADRALYQAKDGGRNRVMM